MQQNPNGEIRKQVMPINVRSDNKLKQLAQQEIVDFVYHHIRKMLKEGKNIEIEGKLGRFFSKSMSRQDQEANFTRVMTIDTISNSTIVYLQPFGSILQFDSQVPNKVYSDQTKYFDMIAKALKRDSSMSSKEHTDFEKFAAIMGIWNPDSFSMEQNDIIVDFGFEDGFRLKVPLNEAKKIVLDKKSRSTATNLDFALLGQHYRISAREEEEITDEGKIIEKKLAVNNKNYSSVRIKYRKAYKYLFMEFAFTRVFHFQRVKKMKLEAQDQLEQELFDEFAKEVASKVLNRKKFSRAGQLFFQRAFDLKFNDHIKFECELEIKSIQEYFAPFFTDKNEFHPESQQQIQSNIRSFIRNLVSLSQISDFYGQYYLNTIKIQNESSNETTSISEYKPSILGEYLESM